MPTWLIALVGGLLFFCTVLPGAYLWWPKRGDPVRRIDLGLALLTGAIIGFSLLVLQLLIQVRSTHDEHARQAVATQLQFLSEIGKDKDLTGRDLHKQDLSSQYLAGKILKGAILSQAKLGKADLNDAHLEAADLTNADLRSAHLEGSRLDQADARHARLQGAYLASAVLDGADLSDAHLEGAHLADASLRANLKGAHLVGADLYGADLASANLKGADLTGANLTYANLRGASLEGANLKDAYVIDILGERSHNIDPSSVSFATYDSETRWPDGRKWGCKQSPCWRLFRPPETAPAQLSVFKRLLVAAEHSPELRGWKANLADPLGLTLIAPGNHAVFTVDSLDQRQLSLSQYAMRAEGEQNECFSRTRKGCPPGLWVRMGGVRGVPRRGQAYARRFSSKGMTYMGLYYVENVHHYRFLATAQPDFFELFQPDFTALFRAIGIRNDLFPELFPQLSARLIGKAETPNKGTSGGNGGVNIDLKPAHEKICWQFRVSGIGVPRAANIYTGQPGTVGRLFIRLGSAFRMRGCAAANRTRIEAVELKPSDFYVNLFTKAFPGGAIRGQLADGMVEVYGMPEL